MIIFKDNAITVFQSVLYKTNSTIIKTDDVLLVVDPSWLPNEIIDMRHYVEDNRGKRDVYLIFTHSDYDHIIGYKAFKNIKTIASEEFISNPNKDIIIDQIKNFDDHYYIARDYEIAYPEINYSVREDGQRLNIGDTCLTFYKAPGHTKDSIFTVIDNLNLLIAGDYCSDIEFPFIYYSSTEYEKTLSKLNQIIGIHEVQTLIPGHGSILCDVNMMQDIQLRSSEYIKQLKFSIANGLDDDLENFVDTIPFPQSHKKSHKDNIKQILTEVMEKS